MIPKVHRRQYVIGPRKFLPDETWVSIALPHGLFLSHSSALPVSIHQGPGNEFRAILGIAVSCADKTPQESAESSAGHALLEESSFWSGRWIQIAGSTMQLDAGGLLGCYYSNGGEFWLSSSPALLAKLIDDHGGVSRRLRHGEGIDWYPMPGSGFSSIRRLIPGEIIDLATGSVRFSPNLKLASSEPADLEALCGNMIRVVQRMAAQAARVFVPLTAGYDSRLVLAACMRAGLRPITVTQVRPGMSESDQTLPPILAEIAGCEHHWIPPSIESLERKQVYDEHTARHTVGVDRDYFVRGQLSWADPEDAILRGGGFEVGRCNLWRQLSPGRPTPETIENSFGGKPDISVRESLALWIANLDQYPIPGVDWRDRFYLENRIGGWLSAVEQSLDLEQGLRFHLANSAHVYSQLLSFPVAVRQNGAHQVEAIRHLFSDLAQAPFNRLP